MTNLERILSLWKKSEWKQADEIVEFMSDDQLAAGIDELSSSRKGSQKAALRDELKRESRYRDYRRSLPSAAAAAS